MNHFVKKCKICNKVIEQCRCLACDKTTILDICDSCKESTSDVPEPTLNYENPIRFEKINDRLDFDGDHYTATFKSFSHLGLSCCGGAMPSKDSVKKRLKKLLIKAVEDQLDVLKKIDHKDINILEKV